MTRTERKLYKVLRNVGLTRVQIVEACTREEFFLDHVDTLLLLYYFEHEFKIAVKDDDITKLNTLNQVHHFVEMAIPA